MALGPVVADQEIRIRLTYLGPWNPCVACNCNNLCKQGNCAECCERRCTYSK
jgi:hypothetical protein